MQFNYYFLKVLTPVLNQRIVGLQIAQVFSQNKNELIIIFDGKDDFVIKANLDHDYSLLSFPNDFARARKNSVNLFEEIFDCTVLKLRQFENERSFSIVLSDGYQLVFKLHGRHANVILYQDDGIISVFKQSQEKDRHLKLNELERIIDQSDEQILKKAFDLKSLYPTFDKHIKNRLKADGFYESEDDQARLEMLRRLVGELESGRQYIAEVNGLPQLFIFKPDNYSAAYDDPIEASNAFARKYFKEIGLNGLKNKLVNQTKKEIKKCESYLTHTTAKLTEIENRRGYDEIANILMANLHQPLTKGSKTIELTDFYANRPITIKINPNLSLQQNAELLYRKSKNQGKETFILKNNIESKTSQLEELHARLMRIESAEDIKSLKSLDQSDPNNQRSARETPFMEFEINGYQVFAGKNAKNNDLLTQKFARKDDLWLHARDVSGSHVIIRNPNGTNIPDSVIEKVAQIAAWYSKRKTDSLCPVIYTPKKYVRKPKGSLPGQVVLSQEKVMMVKPGKL